MKSLEYKGKTLKTGNYEYEKLEKAMPTLLELPLCALLDSIKRRRLKESIGVNLKGFFVTTQGWIGLIFLDGGEVHYGVWKSKELYT